jgi:hypothetical protein
MQMAEEERVIAGTPFHDVIAKSADDRIVTAAAEEEVTTSLSIDGVGAIRAEDEIGA